MFGYEDELRESNDKLRRIIENMKKLHEDISKDLKNSDENQPISTLVDQEYVNVFLKGEDGFTIKKHY